MSKTGRPPKPSVRYYLPKERADKNGQTKLRGVASYAKKRLSFSLTLEEWQLFQVFNYINSDGSLREDTTNNLTPEDYNDCNHYAFWLNDLSGYLVYIRDLILELIERAVAKGVWKRMTSADMAMFINFTCYSFDDHESNEKDRRDFFRIFDTWAKKTK